jgi:hypothetical protein
MAMLASFLIAAAAATDPAAATETQAAAPTIVVIASRPSVIGTAATASEGRISAEEIALRPIYRPGQLFESIPGLVVTIHSGEGKAQQYLIRGYNLDHGTDFANFVDDMPVNRPTNAHGQGYSDISFLIPQLVAGIDYTKGPYHAAIGDFGSVASSHTRLARSLPTQVAITAGTDGQQELLAAGTTRLGRGDLTGALQLAHLDGPWQPPENFRKVNAALRYAQGTAGNGFTLTALAYASAGRLMTDQPARAIEQGMIGPYGTLDPTDASRSQRYSLSAHLDRPIGAAQLALSLYAIRSSMSLWNNFTHYLDDPVNGDQQQQDESRTTLGGAASLALTRGIVSWTGGFQLRYDAAFVDRRHTVGRTTVLPTCFVAQDDGPALAEPAVDGFCNADRIRILTLSPWSEATLRPLPWLRAVVGIRADHTHAADRSLITGIFAAAGQWLIQPKASLVIAPSARAEFYLSAGRGFHSNDVRGSLGAVSTQSIAGAASTPLLSATSGIEAGLRATPFSRLSVQLAVFQQDFGSELTYNADTGQTEPGAPSRRQGIEISAQYHPFRWLELNTDLAFSRPRYHTQDLAAFGLDDPWIADAPDFIYSAGALVQGAGRWSGALQWRRLGTHSLVDGQHYPRDGGFSEWNLDVGYALGRRSKLQIGIFNLFNSRGSAASYYYTARLPGETAEGVAGYQRHPLEPRSARFTVARQF